MTATQGSGLFDLTHISRPRPYLALHVPKSPESSLIQFILHQTLMKPNALNSTVIVKKSNIVGCLATEFESEPKTSTSAQKTKTKIIKRFLSQPQRKLFSVAPT